MGRLEKVLAILSGIGFLAGAVAGLLKQEVELETYIFWGFAALFLLGCITVWLFRFFKGSGRGTGPLSQSGESQHRNLGFRKSQYEIDCAAEDNGRENGGVWLNLRRSILSYENTEKTIIRHRKEFQVTAKVNGVREFHDRYMYSADRFDVNTRTGICKLTAPERRQNITNIRRSDGWVFYTIHRSDPIRQNHSGEFVMEMPIINDPLKQMEPFLSSGIYEPTEKLELELQFPPKLDLRNPRVKIYNNYSAGTEIDTIYPNEDPEHFICDYEHGKLSYRIEYPIYGYKYRMEWDFTS